MLRFVLILTQFFVDNKYTSNAAARFYALSSMTSLAAPHAFASLRRK